MSENEGSSDGPDLSASAAVLRSGLALSGLDLTSVYAGYLGVAGTMTAGEVRDHLGGTHEVSPIEHDYLAQALNDHFTARGQDHPVAYSDELDHLEPGLRKVARPRPSQG